MTAERQDGGGRAADRIPVAGPDGAPVRLGQI